MILVWIQAIGLLIGSLVTLVKLIMSLINKVDCPKSFLKEISHAEDHELQELRDKIAKRLSSKPAL